MRDLEMAVEAALTPTSCPMDDDPAVTQCPHAACWMPPSRCKGERRPFDARQIDDDADDEDCQHEWELCSEHDTWVCAWCQAETTLPPANSDGGAS